MHTLTHVHILTHIHKRARTHTSDLNSRLVQVEDDEEEYNVVVECFFINSNVCVFELFPSPFPLCPLV